jgi:hypothetical protein
VYAPLAFGPILDSGSTTCRRFVRPPDPARRTAGPGQGQLAAGPTGRLRDGDQGSVVVCQTFWYTAHSKATGGGLGAALAHGGTGRKKPTCLPCGAVHPPKARPSGPYSCLPTNSLPSMWWRPSPMKQSDRHSKKHPQAAPIQELGDSSRAPCRLCGPHGGCPAWLSAPL